MRKLIIGTLATFAAVIGALLVTNPASVLACAGLIGSNGAVNLNRTSTLAAYHEGVEHYVTDFEIQGGGGEFGTLIPLPGVPSNVERGGAWTLQRLAQETGADASGLQFYAFKNLEENVRAQVQKIKSSPFLSDDIPVSGFIYQVEDGRLRQVV